MKWKEIDWDTAESAQREAATTLLAELVADEGSDAPMQPEELATELAQGAKVRLWFGKNSARPGEPDSGTDGAVLDGFAVLRQDGTVRTVLRQEHREMSIFLPMLQWADATWSERVGGPQLNEGTAQISVLAQDDDICVPYLLLRLEFSGEPQGAVAKGSIVPPASAPEGSGTPPTGTPAEDSSSPPPGWTRFRGGRVDFPVE